MNSEYLDKLIDEAISAGDKIEKTSMVEREQPLYLMLKNSNEKVINDELFKKYPGVYKITGQYRMDYQFEDYNPHILDIIKWELYPEEFKSQLEKHKRYLDYIEIINRPNKYSITLKKLGWI